MFVYQRIFKREQHIHIFIVGGINKFIIIRKEVQMSRETILYYYYYYDAMRIANRIKL